MNRKRFTISLFILSVIPGFLCSQEAFKFQKSQASAIDIIKALESELQIKFNYDTQLFEDDQLYSLSVEGSQEHVINTAFSLLDKNPNKIKDGIYIIQPYPMQIEHRIDPSIYRIKITDNDMLALSHCIAEIKSLEKVFESNRAGLITIEGYFSPDVLIELSYTGFKNKKFTIGSLKQNQANVITLETDNYMLGEVIVRDQRLFTETDEIQSSEYYKQDQSLSTSLDGNGLSISQLSPGVYSSTESLHELQVRGGPPDQTNVSWNGIQLYQNSLFYGKVGSVNPFMTDGVYVNKNGGFSKNGKSSMGSIEMRSDLSQIDKTRFKIHSNLLYSNFGVSGQLFDQKLQFKGAARSSYNNLFKGWVYQNYFDQSFQEGRLPDDQFYLDYYDIREYVSFTPQFGFHDYNAAIQFNPHEKLFVEFNTLNTKNEFSYIEHNDDVDNLLVDNLKIKSNGYSSKMGVAWDSIHTTTFHINQSKFQYLNSYFDWRSPVTDPVYRSNDNMVKHRNFGLNHQIHLGNHKINLALNKDSWNASNVDSITLDTLYYDTNDKNQAYELSAYIEHEFSIADKLFFKEAWRWSDYELAYKEELILEPQLHLRWEVFPGFNIHGHYSKTHQNINRRNHYSPLAVESGFWYLSDEGVNSSNWIMIVRNKQYSAGVNYMKDHWKVSLDVYKKEISDIWSAAYDFTSEENPWIFLDAEVKGLEAKLQYQKNNYQFMVAVNAMDDILKDDYGFNIKSPYLQPLRVDLSFSKSWEKFHFSANWNFAKGKYYVDPIGIVTLVNSKGEEYDKLEFDYTSFSQLPNYHKLDLNLRYETLRKEKWQLDTGINIINAYNRRNVIRNQFYTNYLVNPNEMAFRQKLGLPFTPNIFIEVNF